MQFNIPDSNKPRIVIVGAGFAGFYLANNLKTKGFQIVLLDKNNYFQFQPLFYQVAMSGLEPSSICFPLRKNFQNEKDFYVRVAEVTRIIPEQNQIDADIGRLNYDYLVLAMGAKTNYYGKPDFQEHSIPLKSVSEALFLRNAILQDLEQAVTITEPDEQEELLDIVIVGGGPTGVELAGALAEMKKHIVPKDYPDLNIQKMDIHLIQSSSRLLDSMTESASKKALKDLLKMGVQVYLKTQVADMRASEVILSDGRKLKAKKIIWAAGVQGAALPGLAQSVYDRSGRILVDTTTRVKDMSNVFAIGDISLMITDKYPKGLPGLAPVAMQQAAHLAKYLYKKKPEKLRSREFRYIDKGSMATIGRSKAVLDFHGIFLSGFIAWFAWLFVHIYYLIGVRNRLVVFINWLWSYICYDQALRLNIKPKIKP